MLTKIYGILANHEPKNDLVMVWPNPFVLGVMACGTPVVTTKYASLPEVAEDAAYYIEQENENAVFSAFETFENQSSIIQDLQSRGLRQAAKFTWRKCAKKTLAVYQNCLRD